jgi:hypothetical protein
MALFTRSHLSAASAGIVLTLVAGGGIVLASGQAATRDAGHRAGVNAAKLNGYRAAQLTKVTSVQDLNPIDAFHPGCSGFTTIKTLRVKNPHGGFLLVTGTVGAARDTDFTDTTELVARLKLGAKLSGEQGTQLVTDGSYDGNIIVQAAFKVRKGKSRIKLQAAADCENNGAAYITSRTVTAFFTPFGASRVAATKSARTATTNR